MSDMLSSHDLGAPFTIHARLKTMRKKGGAMLTGTEDTRRTRMVLTQAVWRYLDRVSFCLLCAEKDPLNAHKGGKQGPAQSPLGLSGALLRGGPWR